MRRRAAVSARKQANSADRWAKYVASARKIMAKLEKIE
jgi:hypothetical protein